MIDELKQSKIRELEPQNMKGDCCSETDTEGDDCLSNEMSNRCSYPTKSDFCSSRSCKWEELNDDVPLISFFHAKKISPKRKEAVCAATCNDHKVCMAVSPQSSSKASGHTQTVLGRKRVRIILSDDDEEEDAGVGCSKEANLPFECVATSREGMCKSISSSNCRHSMTLNHSCLAAVGKEIRGPAASPFKYQVIRPLDNCRFVSNWSWLLDAYDCFG